MADDLIGVEIGSYRLTSALGSGGMGAVYLGVHPLIGKRVAIKVLHGEAAEKPDAVGRFFNEARAVSLLRHPHIVELIDFGRLDLAGRGSLYYCIMELLEGATLRQRLDREGALPELLATGITAQIAAALAAAHHHQIIHRDLKPENIFLGGPQEDFVKILDFGVAKLHEQNAVAEVHTQAGILVGTPAYMSPEQCMGRPVDPRTDVYALGILLFEMCTGRVPFTGEGYADLLVRQVMNEPPPMRSINPAISERLERIVLRALAKDPAARFQSMEEFEAALATPDPTAITPVAVRPTPAAASAPTIRKTPVPTRSSIPPSAIAPTPPAITSAPPPPAVTSAAPPPARRPSLALIGGLLGGLALGGGLISYLFSKPADAPPAVLSAPPDSPPTSAPQPRLTRLIVRTQPAGAEVRRADTRELLGTTPLDKQLPADGTLVPLLIHKDGHQDEHRAIVLGDQVVEFEFFLPPQGAPAGVTPGTTPPSPAPVKKPSGKRTPQRTGTGKTAPGSLGDDILAPQ